METIEQIKQEKDKLQERLNNAANFFREQKAKIEALTKENEELKNEKKEITLDSSEEILKENNELKVKLQNSNEAYEELRKKYQELKELNDGDLKRYNGLEDNYGGLQNKYQELEKQKNEAEEKAKILNDNLRDIEKTTNSELKKACEERDSWLTKYKELESKFKENDIAKDEAELKASNLQSEYEKIFDKQNKEIKDLNTQVETLNKKIKEEVSNNVANKVLLDETNQAIESKEKEYKVLQDTLNEIKDEFDKLNIKYNDLENEKLAWEADYKNLEDKFDLLKENKEIGEDILENIMGAIRQIHQITDDILDPKPVAITKDDDIKLPLPIDTQNIKKLPIEEKSNNFGLHDLGESAII